MTTPAAAPRDPGRWRQILFPPPNHENKDNPIGSAFALTVIAVFVQGLSRFGYSLLIGNILGTEKLGQVNQVIALGLFLVLLWPQASGTAASKYIAMARGKSDADQQASVALYTSRSAFVGMTILSVAAVFIAIYAQELPLSYALSAGLLVIALSAYNFVRGVRTGNNQFVTTTFWDCISSFITLTLLLVVLLAELNPLLLLPLCLGYLIYAIPAWPRRGGSKLSKPLKRELLKFTAWGSINILTAAGLLQLSLIIGGNYDSQEAIGHYAAALTIATPASMLSSAMIVALSPSVARMFSAGDMAGMKTQLDAIMRTMVLVFLPIFGVGILWAEPLVMVLYGARYEEFEGAIPLLIVLFFAVSTTSFNAANSRLNGGEHWGVRTLALCNATGMALGIITMVWWGPELGMMAAAIGYLIGCIISSMVPLIIVWVHDRMPWAGVMLRILTGYALALLCLWLTYRYDSLLVTIGASVAFLLVWCAMSWRDLAPRLRMVTGRFSKK